MSAPSIALKNEFTTLYDVPYHSPDVEPTSLARDLSNFLDHVVKSEKLHHERMLHVSFLGADRGKVLSTPAFRLKERDQAMERVKTRVTDYSYAINVQRITIRVLHDRAGGCARNHDKVLKEEGKRFISPAATNDNCFFKCLVDELSPLVGGKMTKTACNKLREKMGVQPNHPIDISAAQAFITSHPELDHVGIENYLVRPDASKVLKLIGAGHCVVGHWVYFTGINQHLCSKCGMSYWFKHDSSACALRESFLTSKREKKREMKQRMLYPVKPRESLSNNERGVLHYDIETYNAGSKGAINQLVCMGYEFHNGTDWEYRFLSGDDCLVRFINELAELPQHVEYLNAYNGSNFDHFETLKAWLSMPAGQDQKEEVDITLNSGSVIGGSIAVGKRQTKRGKRDRRFRFVDLAKHGAPGPLAKKLKAFKVDTLKGDIDYKRLAKWETLDAQFQEEVKAYQRSDVVGLRKLFNIMNAQVHDDFGVNVTDFYSCSHRCYELWRRERFLKDKIGLPTYKQSCFYRRATYGGRTYKNKTHFRSEQMDDIEAGKVKYDDVNDYCVDMDVVSLYPAAMAHNEYPIGREIETQDEVPGKMGIYRCKVTCPKNILTPQLPRHDGGLKWDLIDREQHLTSEDMRRAREYGYKIEVLEGFYWDRSAPVFSDYIQTMYKKKQQAEKDTPQYVDAKLALNGLYGKMIQRPITSATVVVKTFEDLFKIMNTRQIDDIDDVPEEGWLIITHSPKEEIELNKTCTKPTHLGAFVLSFSRTIMSEYITRMNPDNTMEDLFHYTDTDSIQTHVRCGSRVPETKGLGGIDNDLPNGGKIIEGVWIAPKLYRLTYITRDGEIHQHVRGKGVNGRVFDANHEWYDRMRQGEAITGDEVWAEATRLDVPCFKRVHFKRTKDQREARLPLFSIIKDTRERTLNKTRWSGRQFDPEDDNVSTPHGYQAGVVPAPQPVPEILCATTPEPLPACITNRPSPPPQPTLAATPRPRERSAPAPDVSQPRVNAVSTTAMNAAQPGPPTKRQRTRPPPICHFAV